MIRMGLHSFLVTMEQRFFSKGDFNSEDFVMFRMFWGKAPVYYSVKKWMELGTIETILTSLSENQHTSHEALELLFFIGSRIKEE